MNHGQLVIYHGDCVDGFASAWAAWKKYGDTASYYAALYDEAPPLNVVGRDVLIVDFCYPAEVIREIAEKAESVLVLDHHRTNEENFESLKNDCPANIQYVFDTTRSGAAIAWDELHGGERPWIIDYVQDRDLWSWKLDDSKTINAYLQVAPKTFADWSRLVDLGADHAKEVGQFVEMGQRHYIELVKRQARLVRLGDHEGIPCVNAVYYSISEIVGELAEQDGVPFAIGWFQRADGLFQYSLRSRKSGFDVGRLAESFGGGGHPQSSGFTSNVPVHE